MHQQKTNLDSIRLEKLHRLLIQKIEDGWQQKWQRHGDFNGINKLPSLNAFLEDLLEDIEKTIKSKLGLKATAEILISKDSLRRFIQQLQTNAKFKTRQTLALYIGYEGWDDFSEKNESLLTITTTILPVASADATNFVETHQEEESTETNTEGVSISSEIETFELPQKQSFFSWQKNGKKLLVGIIVLLLLGLTFSAIAISYFSKEDKVFFRLLPFKENNFPTVAYIQYDPYKLDIHNTYIKQHNQPLDWYLKNDTRLYKLDTITGELYAKNSRIAYFDKPGLYHLELVSNDKTIQEIAVPVRAKDWFGIAYAQEKQGRKEFVYSNVADWTAYKSQLGKKRLSLPREFLKGNALDSRYRSDFYYSGDIN